MGRKLTEHWKSLREMTRQRMENQRWKAGIDNPKDPSFRTFVITVQTPQTTISQDNAKKERKESERE